MNGCPAWGSLSTAVTLWSAWWMHACWITSPRRTCVSTSRWWTVSIGEPGWSQGHLPGVWRLLQPQGSVFRNGGAPCLFPGPVLGGNSFLCSHSCCILQFVNLILSPYPLGHRSFISIVFEHFRCSEFPCLSLGLNPPGSGIEFRYFF